MKRFAELLEALVFTPSRNGKLRLMEDYFREAPDPDRGWALAALTGGLTFAHAKPALMRGLVGARVDPVLFGWSYDFVGDLAETVALIWPERPGAQPATIAGRSGRDLEHAPAAPSCRRWSNAGSMRSMHRRAGRCSS